MKVVFELAVLGPGTGQGAGVALGAGLDGLGLAFREAGLGDAEGAGELGISRVDLLACVREGGIRLLADAARVLLGFGERRPVGASAEATPDALFLALVLG